MMTKCLGGGEKGWLRSCSLSKTDGQVDVEQNSGMPGCCSATGSSRNEDAHLSHPYTTDNRALLYPTFAQQQID